MDFTLILSAFLMGLAGTPHCAAMCGAPCAAIVGHGPAQARAPALAFHLTRLAGYGAAGAAAAAGVGVLTMAGSAAPFVRPIWTLLHMAALALGLWLLLTGRQPAFMTRVGRERPSQLSAAGEGARWQIVQTPWTAAAAGAAWVAWPCGLLQSALVVAALGNSPQIGAMAMVAFGLASAGGLQAAPILARRLHHLSPRAAALGVRVAGLALALGSGWALGHDLWVRVSGYCAT